MPESVLQPAPVSTKSLRCREIKAQSGDICMCIWTLTSLLYLLSTRAFLYLDGHVLEPVQQDEVATMLAVADGSLDEQQLALWLHLNSQRAYALRTPPRIAGIPEYLALTGIENLAQRFARPQGAKERERAKLRRRENLPHAARCGK
jgi:hypothetical protein